MASVGHLAVGALAGAVYARSTGARPVTSMAGFALLALAPDVDLLWIEAVTGESPWAHRAATHSIVFALAGGLLAWLAPPVSRRALRGLLTAASLASHGVLDALTALGDGPKLLWPLSHGRTAFGWTPIPGAEGFREYFGPGAWSILLPETLLFLPVALLALAIAFFRPGRSSTKPAAGGPVEETA